MNINFIDLYIKWLQENMEQEIFEDSIEIKTPFLDNHNDHIHIYAEYINGKYFLSDDAYTINDLEMCGCSIKNAPQRKKILNIITNMLGVKHTEEDEIIVEADESILPVKMHMLLHAIMSVSNMFMLSTQNVKKIFVQDVANFFELNEIKYTTKKNISGKSGLVHTIDFYINSSKKKKLISVLNDPTQKNAKPILFSLYDIKEKSEDNYNNYVIINNKKKNISKNILDAFSNYNTQPILWSEINDFIPYFTS